MIESLSGWIELPNLDVMSGFLLRWLGLSLLYGTALVVVTWVLLKTVFRRARAAFIASIWTIVLLKFVIPTGPGWSWSLASLVEDVSGSTLRVPIPTPPATEPAQRDGSTTSSVQYVTVVPERVPIRSAVAATAASSGGWTIVNVLSAIYLLVVLVILCRRVRRHRQLVDWCRRLPPAGEEVLRLVKVTCKSVGLRRVPSVRLSEEAPAPFIFGLFRPILVLSRRHLEDAAELEAIVLHEIAHFRRGDILLRYLQCLVGTLLFFWPVVAWVNRRIDLAREHSCDNWALFHGRLTAAEYARCLLRALAPVRADWSMYRPAAMAANRGHVERRIEMILHASERGRRARSLGLGALVVLIAWGGFTLTGTSAAEPAPKADLQEIEVKVTKTDDGGTVWIRKVTGPDGQVEEQTIDLNELDGKFKFLLHGEEGDSPKAKFGRWMGDIGELHTLSGEREFAFFGPGHGDQGMKWTPFNIDAFSTLSKFSDEHPMADVDGDGTVTRDERSAYLVAVAMSDQAAVLGQYPKADRNNDGQLDATEAALLVDSGYHHVREHTIGKAAGDDPSVKQHLFLFKPHTEGAQTDLDFTTEGDPKHVIVRRFGSKSKIDSLDSLDEKKFECRVEVIQSEGDGGAGCNVFFSRGASAGEWLLENIDFSPTTADVSQYLQTVAEAPLVVFGERHPEADTDGDGKISAAEQEAFFETMMTGHFAELLKQFPEADLDGNGELSHDELSRHFETLAKDGHGLIKLHLEDGEAAGKHKMMFFHAKDGAAADFDFEPLKIEVKSDGDAKVSEGGKKIKKIRIIRDSNGNIVKEEL